MGSVFSTQQHVEISSHKRNQQIEIMLTNGRRTPVVEHVYALLTCNETVSYCDDIVDYLFKYHLSQATLHYNIMSQLRQLIQFTHELHEYSMFHNIESSLFDIENSKHSCQLIMDQLTEDSPITPEVGKAISIIFEDNAIQHCITIIKMVQDCTKNENDRNDRNDRSSNSININIINNRYNQELLNYVSLKLLEGEYWIDISFCEYFFENIMHYSARICRNNRNYSPLIFNDKTLIDYKLLKNHVTMKNGITRKLCHCDYTTDTTIHSNCNCNSNSNGIRNKAIAREQAQQRNIRFMLETEGKIVIFNIDDDNYDRSSILSLGWYKKILSTFSSIIFCLPLSWFDKIQQELESTYMISPSRETRLSFDKMKQFYQDIVNYDNQRYSYWNKNNLQKEKAKNEYINKHGWRHIPSHLYLYPFNKGPCKSIWIIPDLENIDINVNVTAYSDLENKLIESLLDWKKVFPKYIKKLKAIASADGININSNNSIINVYSTEVRQCNVYFKNLINYTSIRGDIWSKLRRQCFNDGYGMMRFHRRYRNSYRRVGAHALTNEEKEQAGEKSYLHDSNMKHDLNSVYRQRNQCFFHWSYNNAGTRMIHDPRLEYFRIYLNYPTLYKHNQSVYRYYQEYRDGDDMNVLMMRHRNGDIVTHRDLVSHLRVMDGLCRLVSRKWTNSQINDYNHWFGNSIEADSNNRRLNDMFNFVYCDKIEKLFKYGEEMIDNQFDVIDNSHQDIGITIERAICFGFKNRLNTILKNKYLFVDRDAKTKTKKENETKRFGHMVVGNDSGDEFDFENYVRLALNDWNFSLLSLFKKSSRNSRAPFRTTVQRFRMGRKR